MGCRLIDREDADEVYEAQRLNALQKELTQDVESRREVHPDEHPILSRMVVLRIILNHHYGLDFEKFDHELAQIERELEPLLTQKT